MNKLRIGIMGYGNLAKGVEKAIGQSPDMELAAIFTRRDIALIKPQSKNIVVEHADRALDFRGKLDVMILCGGSATDLPELGPHFAENFCTVDSFDTHAKIPEYLGRVDASAKKAGNVSIISAGWDPGLFSLNRLYAECVLPHGESYTFWGPGVSQGHSDAVRRIPGVKNAKQYTIPVEKAIQLARSGDAPLLSTREKHTRLCYVVAEDGADRQAIEASIKNMPNYFEGYDTTVEFITEDELSCEHGGMPHGVMPHGGTMIRSGKTAGTPQLIEYSLKLGSNPEFTGSVLCAYARAAARLYAEGACGAKTVLDVPPSYLSPLSGAELLACL